MSFINDFIHDGETRLLHGIALIGITVINLIVNMVPMLASCGVFLKLRVRKCKKGPAKKKERRSDKYLDKGSQKQDSSPQEPPNELADKKSNVLY